MVETESKRTVLTLLVLIQAAQIVMAGDQPSPQMFILRSHHHADPAPIPFDLFERLEQQLATAERVPNAEIRETETSYTVQLELPGVDRDSIDVKATDRNLVISAERPATGSDDSNAPLLSEFPQRHLEPQLPFPPEPRSRPAQGQLSGRHS